ncbi:Bug family tripartite tricarboxylate transporter substrate binding protein [Acidovorax facilis]|jgi:tripartite-type tricarboxylate transporter receptor subunit TctC|uniref:Bug family tripartite tricarboxylate transporter substrate binding protein n=1 Tax=Acidovorax facilis TaxID=12917 RepID=UPI003D64D455
MTQEKIDRARRRMVSAAGTVPLAWAAGGGTALLAPHAWAQADDWPKRPIRVIVPFPAGALTDTIARVMADGLSKSLGQAVVVENKLGANGVIGASEVARSAPDGYTWLLTNSSSITINPQLYKKIPYKASDLAPITPIMESPFIIVANPEWAQRNKINKLSDLLAYARANPDGVRYGSPGLGNLAHLGALMMSNRANVKTLHIPYKGGSPAQLAVMSGEIDFVFDTWAGLPLIQSGKVKPLAVTSKTRMAQLPDVPTVEESGIPDFSVTFWLGMLAPAGTPPQVLQKIFAASKDIMADPKARASLSTQGNVIAEDPATFAQRIGRETLAWGEVIKRENLSLE